MLNNILTVQHRDRRLTSKTLGELVGLNFVENILKVWQNCSYAGFFEDVSVNIGDAIRLS